MKLKLYSNLAFLAVILLFTACQEFNELNPLNAKKKKSNEVMREIVNGAAIKGANGINFGPDGNLYIGSVAGEEIVVMNKQNGKIIRRLDPEMEVKGTDTGITFH
jgi:hypothetical protein